MRMNRWSVTLSIGIVTFNKFDLSIDEMLHRVDEVMYRVKKSSKDGIAQEEYP